MKKTCSIAMLAFLSTGIYSCTNTSTTEKVNSDSTTVVNTPSGGAVESAGEADTMPGGTTICYLLTEGNDKDSLITTLTMNGNDVTGYLIYNYYQKDGRFGKLIGTKSGNEVNADWIYMQEGMLDTVQVAFRINDSSIEQKRNDFNRNTGEEYLMQDAPYTRTYRQVDCTVTQELVDQVKNFL